MDRQIDLPMPAELPLRGWTILVTRPPHQARQFSRRLEEGGARVVCISTIDIQPPADWEACDRAIEAISTYDAIVLTSANAAESLFDRAATAKPGSLHLLRASTIFAVGGNTRRAAEKFGVRCATFADVGNAEQLAKRLIMDHRIHRRYMFPKGNLTRSTLPDMLRAAGFVVDEVEVYRTVPAGGASRLSDIDFAGGRAVDIVTFFSPSTAEVFFDMVEPHKLAGCAIAAIGSTTADALRNRGVSVHIIPARPTSGDLADAIVRYCGKEKRTRATIDTLQ